jgi:hypothetical protein
VSQALNEFLLEMMLLLHIPPTLQLLDPSSHVLPHSCESQKFFEVLSPYFSSISIVK